MVVVEDAFCSSRSTINQLAAVGRAERIAVRPTAANSARTGNPTMRTGNRGLNDGQNDNAG
jgi:hypothetical protein